MIIDIHGHIGNVNLHPDWAADAGEVDRIRKAAGVDRVVASSAMSIMYDVRAGNSEMIEAVGKYGNIKGYMVVNPLFPDSLDDLDHAGENPGIVGCKIHPDYHGYDVLSPVSRKFIEKVVKKTGLVLFHTSCMPGLSFSSADSLCRVARDHPETDFVLAHLAGIFQNPLYPYFVNISGAEKVAEWGLDNVYIDSAHFLMYAYKGVMERVYSCLGADRILFGTDVPLQSEMQVRFALEAIRAMDIPREDKDKILGGNALRLTGMSNA